MVRGKKAERLNKQVSEKIRGYGKSREKDGED